MVKIVNISIPEKPLSLSDNDINEIDEDLNKIAIDNTKNEIDNFIEELGGIKNKKDLKRIKKKAKALYMTNYAGVLTDRKKEISDEVNSFEEQFLYKDSLFKRVKKGVIFWKHGAIIQAFFINKDGTTYLKEYNVTPEGVIKDGNRHYNVVSKCFIRFAGRPTLFFYENNPNPIFFNNEKKENIALISPESLYNIHQANIVKQLFKAGGIGTGGKIALSVGLVFIIGIVIVMIIGSITGGVSEVVNAGLLLPLTKWIKKKN